MKKFQRPVPTNLKNHHPVIIGTRKVSNSTDP